MRRCGSLGLFVCSSLACGRPIPSASTGAEASETTDASSTSTSTTDATGSSATETSGTDTSTTWTPNDAVEGCMNFMTSVGGSFVPSDLLLVVDASTSMGAETWDHDGDPMTPEIARWSAARTFVEQLLAATEGKFRFGLQRYPAAEACMGMSGMCSDADVCLLGDGPEVALALDGGADILAALPSVDAQLELVGGSPTRAAFLAARDALEQAPNPVIRNVVLITDGGSNCSEGALLPDAWEQYDLETAPAIQAGRDDADIFTVVVGVGVPEQDLVAGEDSPLTNPFAALNELAIAGGVPQDGARKFFTQAELPELIASLNGGLSDDWTCIIDLDTTDLGPPEPISVPYLELEVAGELVPYLDAGCGQDDGWTWLEYGRVLSMCGSYCEQFGHGEITVDIFYNCPPD